MSRAYYYFAATLPMASLQGPMPVSLEEFRRDAERLLSAEDSADLGRVIDGDLAGAGHPFVRRWGQWMRELRHEIVAASPSRAEKAPAGAIQRGFDPAVMETVAQASRQENLLEAEKMILRLMWDHAEEMTRGHFFDLEYIFGYALRLKMIERMAVLTSEAGTEALEAIEAAAGVTAGQALTS